MPELPKLLSASGFKQIRELADGFAVYEFAGTAAEQELHQAVARLKSEGVAIQSAPVFVLQATGSEAVLLNELIVSLEHGVDPESYFANNEMFDSYRPLSGTPNQFVATVAAGVGERALAALQLAQRDADRSVVQWIEPNFYQAWQKYYIPNDPRFGNLWHLHNTGQNGALVDADSDLPEAWDLNAGGSTNYVIGIIDDGVADHPDLNLWANPGEIANNGIDDDNNGWIDDIRGWNFVSNNNQAGPTTSLDTHGTAVAGVAAAMGDNAVGVTGASYNSRVSSARIFQGNSVASDANIASSLYYMAGRTANGLGTWKSADLVNNSWGGGGFSNAVSSRHRRIGNGSGG